MTADGPIRLPRNPALPCAHELGEAECTAMHFDGRSSCRQCVKCGEWVAVYSRAGTEFVREIPDPPAADPPDGWRFHVGPNAERNGVRCFAAHPAMPLHELMDGAWCPVDIAPSTEDA